MGDLLEERIRSELIVRSLRISGSMVLRVHVCSRSFSGSYMYGPYSCRSWGQGLLRLLASKMALRFIKSIFSWVSQCWYQSKNCLIAPG